MQLAALMALLLEWVILITTAAPLLLQSSRFTIRNPRTAIALWFGTLVLATVALAVAFTLGVITAVSFWAQLESQKDSPEKIFWAFVFSFVPWILLAFAGITLVLINQRLEPVLEAKRLVRNSIDILAQQRRSDLPSRTFGVEVFEIQLAAPLAFAVSTRKSRRIVLSSGLQELLDPIELQAAVAHEFAHLKQHHQWQKTVAGLIARLTPWLVASKVLVFELSFLCEYAADDAVFRKSQGVALLNALKKMHAKQPDPEVKQRIERLLAKNL